MKRGLHNIISYRILSVLLIICMIFSTNISIVQGLASETKELTESEKARKAYEEKMEQAKEYKAELEKKKKKTEKKLAELEAAKADIETFITQLDEEMVQVIDELFALREEIAATEAELEQTRLDLEQAKETEADHYETMKNRIRYMYENGETSILEVVLASGSLTEMLNNAEYAYRIADYDNKLLEKYIASKQEVMDQEASLEASLEKLGAMEETAEYQQESLETLKEAKNEEVAKYMENIELTDTVLMGFTDALVAVDVEMEQIEQDEKDRLAEEERRRKEEEERKRREEEERRKREEAERLAREQQGSIGKPTSTAGYDADAINKVVLTDETDASKMIWPLPGDYRTFSRFGYRDRPLPTATRYHQGWDIGGELGAPIVSTLAGTAYYGYNASAGNYVRVVHENGIETYYCHCYKILIENGQQVQQGTKVALVGSTGASTGPHVHFGVKKNGAYVDPAPYIAHFVD